MITILDALDTLKDSHKTVLVRVDFNVPVQNHQITDPTRILSVKPTIDLLHQHGLKIILISHFKNPKDDDIADPERKAEFSFKPILSEISQHLRKDIVLLDFLDPNIDENIQKQPQDSVILLDNSRFWSGEKECDTELSQRLADLADFFVNEAFSCAHRSHASVIGVARILPTYPGLHFQNELNALQKAFQNPVHPVLAVIGGAKVSSKFPILENILPKVDFLAIGGAMVHTFFAYQGLSIGNSLYEPDYIEKASALLNQYREKILFPCDVLAARDLNDSPIVVEVSNGVNGIPENMAAYDIGPSTVLSWSKVIRQAKTIIWNGTLGVAEHPPFDDGSKKIAKIICENEAAFSLAGGGDTLAALTTLGFSKSFSHICTGGGAFLEWLANGSLPAEETFQ